MLKEFKKFVLRGNVVDLAVAVVIGAAFTAVVNAFVKDFLTPLIASVQGEREFAKYAFHVNGIAFPYGDFLNHAITFLLTAAVVFFLVVQPLNHLTEITRRKEPTPDPTTKKCPECLGEVPAKAKRCMHCTSVIKPATKA
ncbi:MAG TPA: large conductance mechanosensitive channel protein MscL [Candidatus Limnocylindrales bacterium]|nr:large conductance mechanosensitive channel protein MscL [Candidatus Limnocylindrales bacterium]